MQPYMWIPLIWLRSLPVWQMGLGVVSALAVLLVVFAGARLPAVRRLLPWVWKVLAVVAVALVIYAYFFRVAAGRLAEHDAIALRSFAWYVMPLGLFTALVGYVAALRRFAARDSVFLLTFSLYATFVFYKIRIVPVHYWATRRFLPIILPGAMLLAAFAAFGRWREDDRGWRYQLRAAAGAVVIAILAVQFWTRFGAAPRPRRVRRRHPAAREAGADVRRQGSGDRRVARRLGRPRAGAAAGLHLRPQRAAAPQPAPRRGDDGALHRVGTEAVRDGLLRRRRRHRAVDQGDRGRADRHRGVPGAGVVVGVERPAGRRPAQGVRLQRLPVHRPAGHHGRRRRRPRRRRQRRRQRAAVPRQGAARQRHHVPVVTRRVRTSTCRVSPPTIARSRW